jgi:hypothetical protein
MYAVGGCSLKMGAMAAMESMETTASCEVYDCTSDKWAPFAELRVGRAGVRVIAIGDKYVAAVGGCKNVFGDAEALPTVELLDPKQNSWVELETQLSVPRTIAAVAAVDSHRILVFGGVNRITEGLPSSVLSSSEIYCVKPPCSSADCAVDDAASTSWTASWSCESREVVDIKQCRSGCHALAVNLPSREDIRSGRGFPVSNTPHVVIVGGECENQDGEIEEQFNTVLCYDVENGTWLPRSQVPVPAMPTRRTALALCNSFGRVSTLPAKRAAKACALPAKRARLG